MLNVKIGSLRYVSRLPPTSLARSCAAIKTGNKAARTYGKYHDFVQVLGLKWNLTGPAVAGLGLVLNGILFRYSLEV